MAQDNAGSIFTQVRDPRTQIKTVSSRIISLGVVHGSMKKSSDEDKLGELLVNAMKDMAIISYAILECSTDGQYIEVLILTQSSMVYLVKARFFRMSSIPGL